MKALLSYPLILIFTFLSVFSYAQKDSLDIGKNEIIYRITKNDGNKYYGIILKQDAREVLIKTEEIGEVYITKSDIKKIEKLDKQSEYKNGQYMGDDPFSTRYYFTANGLPLKKNEGYITFNIWGVDAAFPITDEWTVGIMSTYILSPFAVSTKYSFNLDEGLNLSIGGLAGSLGYFGYFGRYNGPDRYGSNYLGLGFAAITAGNKNSNLNIALGYGSYGYKTYRCENYPQACSNKYQHNDGVLLSIGYMRRVSKNFSFVFDSMVIFPKSGVTAFLNPAFRYLINERKAIQFGFLLAAAENEFIPIPIPMFNYSLKFKK